MSVRQGIMIQRNAFARCHGFRQFNSQNYQIEWSGKVKIKFALRQAKQYIRYATFKMLNSLNIQFKERLPSKFVVF